MLSGQDKEVELLAPDRCDAQEVQSLGRSEHLGADHYLFLSATPVEGQHERSDQIVQGGSLRRRGGSRTNESDRSRSDDGRSSMSAVLISSARPAIARWRGSHELASLMAPRHRDFEKIDYFGFVLPN